ncbi:MAG: hypothetical protein U1A27_06165 [Phycisphaerae bacterium]
MIRRRMTTVQFSGLVAAALALASAASHAQTSDFNIAGQLVSDYSLNANTGIPIKYSQVAAGGLGGSGAVNILGAQDADHTTAAYQVRSFGLSAPGQSVTLSEFVLRQDASLTSTPFLSLGVLSDVTERIDAGTASNSYASIRLNPGTSPSDSTNLATRVFLQTETKVNGGGRIRTTPGITGDLLAGNWYRVSATFAYSSAADLLVSMSLEDWGASGAALVSPVFAFGPTSVALSGLDQVNGDISVWAAFRGFAEGGSDLYDNVTITPEPATALLLVVGALARRGRARRR